jgi:CRP/FNR family transcriptional regulator
MAHIDTAQLNWENKTPTNFGKIQDLKKPNRSKKNVHLNSKNESCYACTVRNESMCKHLNKKDLLKLNAISNIYRKKPKQILCTEGDEVKNLYTIKDGAVRLSKMMPDGRRQITGFLFPGDFFGLSGRSKYPFTAEGITDVELCAFPRQKMTKLFIKLPMLGERTLEMMQEELESFQEQLLLLGRKNATEKLTSFLLTIHKKSGRLNKMDENDIYLPMGRADIADFLGLTIETVSRKFSVLVKQGLIELNGSHHLKILNKKTLQDLANGL